MLSSTLAELLYVLCMRNFYFYVSDVSFCIGIRDLGRSYHSSLNNDEATQ